LANFGDIAGIAAFTGKAETGLTTVPRSPAEVETIIELTQRYLSGERKANRLLFVGEQDGEVVGISSVIPTLGLERPFYSFKRSRHARRSTTPKLSVKYDTLQLTTDFDGYTELASLFISQDARGRGLGRLLSYGRLAFICAHPELFEDRLMSDIRGWTDSAGVSPFWTHLTSKFIPTDFDNADKTSTIDGRFIIELLPSLPIILNTLPLIVGECVGRAHDYSAPALAMLKAVGFKSGDLCDVFDGGPSIECHTDSTLIAKTVVQAKGQSAEGTDSMLHFCGKKEDFMAVIAPGSRSETLASDTAVRILSCAPQDISLARISPRIEPNIGSYK